MAQSEWLGFAPRDADGFTTWGNPANWSGGLLPDLTRDATFALTYNSGTTIRSLFESGFAPTMRNLILRDGGLLFAPLPAVIDFGAPAGSLGQRMSIWGDLTTVGALSTSTINFRAPVRMLSTNGNSVIDIASGGSVVRFLGTLELSERLIKRGFGTLFLDSAITRGGVILEQGTLRVASNASLGTAETRFFAGTFFESTAATNVASIANRTVEMNGNGVFTFTGASPIAIENATMTQAAGANVRYVIDGPVVSLRGTSTLSTLGIEVRNSGALVLDTDAPALDPGTFLTVNNSIFTVRSAQTLASITMSGATIRPGVGRLRIGDASGSLTIFGGVRSIIDNQNGSAALSTSSSTLLINGSAGSDPSADLEIRAKLTGPGGFRVAGVNLRVLHLGAADYAGPTSVGDNNRLTLDGNGQLPASTTLTLEGSGQLVTAAAGATIAGLNGTGTLTNNGPFNVNQGTFNGTLVNNATFRKTGPGQLTLGGNLQQAGIVTVDGGLVVATTPGRAAQLNLNSTFAYSAPSSADAFYVGDLRFPNAGSGQLLLTASAVVLDYSSGPFPQFVENLIRSGYNNGAWNGWGIVSNTAGTDASRWGVGYAQMSQIFTTPTATWKGVQVDATSMLVRFTLLGDSNLDNVVNFDDLLKLAASYNTTGKSWAQGDFTYDGVVNFDDLLKLASNYNQTLSRSLAGDWSLARASVPEPTTLVGLGGLLVAMKRPRVRATRCRRTRGTHEPLLKIAHPRDGL